METIDIEEHIWLQYNEQERICMHDLSELMMCPLRIMRAQTTVHTFQPEDRPHKRKYTQYKLDGQNETLRKKRNKELRSTLESYHRELAMETS